MAKIIAVVGATGQQGGSVGASGTHLYEEAAANIFTHSTRVFEARWLESTRYHKKCE